MSHDSFICRVCLQALEIQRNAAQRVADFFYSIPDVPDDGLPAVFRSGRTAIDRDGSFDVVYRRVD